MPKYICCIGCSNVYKKTGASDLCGHCRTFTNLRLAAGLKTPYKGTEAAEDTPVDPRTLKDRVLNNIVGFRSAFPDFDRHSDWSPNPLPNTSNQLPNSTRKLDSPTMPPAAKKPKAQPLTGFFLNSVDQKYNGYGQEKTHPIPHVAITNSGYVPDSWEIPSPKRLLSKWPVLLVDDLPSLVRNDCRDWTSASERAAKLLAKTFSDENPVFSNNANAAQVADGLCYRPLQAFTRQVIPPPAGVAAPPPAQQQVVLLPHEIVSTPNDIVRRLALYPIEKLLVDAAAEIQLDTEYDSLDERAAKQAAIRKTILCQPFLLEQVTGSPFQMIPRCLSTEAADIHALLCIKEGSPWPHFHKDNTHKWEDRCLTKPEGAQEWLNEPEEEKQKLFGKAEFHEERHIKAKIAKRWKEQVKNAVLGLQEGLTNWMATHFSPTHDYKMDNYDPQIAVKDSMRVGQMLVFRGTAPFHIPITDTSGKYMLFRLSYQENIDTTHGALPALVSHPNMPYTYPWFFFRGLNEQIKNDFNQNLDDDQVAMLETGLNSLSAFFSSVFTKFKVDTHRAQMEAYINAIVYYHGFGISREAYDAFTAANGDNKNLCKVFNTWRDELLNVPNNQVAELDVNADGVTFDADGRLR